MKTRKGDILKTALASDFDGTLYYGDTEEQFMAADIFNILDFQQRGGLFGLCTGRSLNGVKDMIGNFIRPDFYILASGALILDGEERIVSRRCLSLDLLRELYEKYRDRAKIVVQAGNDVYSRDERRKGPIRFESFDELKDMPLYGLSFGTGDVQKAAEITNLIHQEYGDVIAAYQNVTHIDLVAPGVSKGNGARIVKEHFQVGRMCGIGDSYNDIPLLEAVDHSFTFSTSPRPVQDAADDVIAGPGISGALGILTADMRAPGNRR